MWKRPADRLENGRVAPFQDYNIEKPVFTMGLIIRQLPVEITADTIILLPVAEQNVRQDSALSQRPHSFKRAKAIWQENQVYRDNIRTASCKLHIRTAVGISRSQNTIYSGRERIGGCASGVQVLEESEPLHQEASAEVTKAFCGQGGFIWSGRVQREECGMWWKGSSQVQQSAFRCQSLSQSQGLARWQMDQLSMTSRWQSFQPECQGQAWGRFYLCSKLAITLVVEGCTDRRWRSGQTAAGRP